jgi:hypothetical protein
VVCVLPVEPETHRPSRPGTSNVRMETLAVSGRRSTLRSVALGSGARHVRSRVVRALDKRGVGREASVEGDAKGGFYTEARSNSPSTWWLNADPRGTDLGSLSTDAIKLEFVNP